MSLALKISFIIAALLTIGFIFWSAIRMAELEDKRCVMRWKDLSEETPYRSVDTGCMIKIKGHWVPTDKVVIKVE